MNMIKAEMCKGLRPKEGSGGVLAYDRPFFPKGGPALPDRGFSQIFDDRGVLV